MILGGFDLQDENAAAEVTDRALTMLSQFLVSNEALELNSTFKVYLPNLQNFRILLANFLLTYVLKLYAYKKPGKLSTIPFFL